MLYPTITEYIASLENAEDNFASKTNLRPVYKEDGMIHFTSGNFAVVFKMRDCTTNKYYAVKCFIKDQERRAESYKLISEELRKIDSPYFVKYDYLENELFVDSQQSNEEEFPVVVMEWVEGVTLDTYVKKLCAINDSFGSKLFELEELYNRFFEMAAWLQSQPIAHGDLKHDNIMVLPNGNLVLVDYDGMYVPAMCGQDARELGSPDYRHPNRTINEFNENIDFFPLVTIALSLRALRLMPFLYRRYATNDRLLLTEKDFRNIEQSEVLTKISALTYDVSLESLYSSFILCMNRPISRVIKTLQPFHKNCNISSIAPLSDKFLKDYSEYWWTLLSYYHPLTEELIEKYKNKCDWYRLSWNRALPLTEQLIEKYKDKWNWNDLSRNTALPWTEQLIEKYKDKWEWNNLRDNTAIPWTEQLIEKYKDKWKWDKLSCNTVLPWTEKLIEKYKDKWEWNNLSNNTELPWTEQFIEKYKDKWEWDSLSWNTELPWTEQFIEKYKDKWRWDSYYGLSGNTALPWTKQFIEKYKDKWVWYGLSWNRALPLTEQLIEKYKDKWNWNDLSRNTALPWTEQLIEKYKDKWEWNNLRDNTAIPWTEQLIEKYKDKWNWYGLSENTALPWTEKFIEKYKDKWNWFRLSSNIALPWTEQLIEKYKDKWDWDRLNSNTAMPWTEQLIEKYKDKWDWDYYYGLSDKKAIYEQLFKNITTDKLDYLYKYKE